MSVIMRELPATGKVESAVKLANGKAAEVCRVYLEHSVTVTERDSSWVPIKFYYLTSNGARVVDNVLFAREPGNPFDHSYVREGWPFVGQLCIHFLSFGG